MDLRDLLQPLPLPRLSRSRSRPGVRNRWQNDEVERRCNEDDVLVLRRGQARLLIWETHAELVVGSRALDTLGGIVGWARDWLTWASAWLLGATLDRERSLEAADEIGWSPIAVDLAADLGGWGPLLDEHQDPERWTQQTVPIPMPAG